MLTNFNIVINDIDFQYEIQEDGPLCTIIIDKGNSPSEMCTLPLNSIDQLTDLALVLEHAINLLRA